MKLRDKVAIVTGSGRGIGRAIARRFAAEGAAVLVTARTFSECDAVAREIKAAAQGASGGGRAVALAADVSKVADCERIVAAARQHFGRVDILVNNAGIYGPVKPIEEITPEEWDALWRQHSPDRPRPQLDLSREMAAGVFLGSRPTAGFNIEIVGTAEKDGVLVVHYRETRPPGGARMRAPRSRRPPPISSGPARSPSWSGCGTCDRARRGSSAALGELQDRRAVAVGHRHRPPVDLVRRHALEQLEVPCLDAHLGFGTRHLRPADGPE